MPRELGQEENRRGGWCVSDAPRVGARRDDGFCGRMRQTKRIPIRVKLIHAGRLLTYLSGNHRFRMNPIAITQDEWTVHALNIHGVFFERRCADAVVDTPDWKVLSTNYPVEFPPPNGPWRGKESSLDIWARRDTGSNSIVDVLIECKKANPEFVNWIFFPKGESPSPTPFSFVMTTNSHSADQSAWTSQTRIMDGTTGLSMSNDAREVRGDYVKHKSGNKTRTSNAAIQEAAYQVALANSAIVHEDSLRLDKARISPQHLAPPWISKSYVPIIVTTAKLFRADFSSRGISLDVGEINLKDVTLSPIQDVVYEYALPKHLQASPANPLDFLKGGNDDAFTRMHIIVVHAGSLSNLLSGLFINKSSSPQQ